MSKKFTAIFVLVIEQCFATIPKQKKKNLLEIPWNPKGDILRSLALYSHMEFHHFWSNIYGGVKFSKEAQQRSEL